MSVSTPIQARKNSVRKDSKLSGFLPFGGDNLLPNKVIDIIRESPTASACIKSRAEFIEGNGFYDKRFWKLKVNRRGMTMDRLLSATARNVSYFKTIVIHVGYNLLGEVSSLQPVPFEIVRLGEPDDLNEISKAAIFPYLESDYFKNKKHDRVEFPLYNPDPEVVFSQIEAAKGIENYKGQLLYLPLGYSSDYYPMPDYEAALDDIRTESGLIRFDFNTVASGFNVSGIVVGLGPRLGQQVTNGLAAQLAPLMGAENAGDLAIMEFETQEEIDAFKFVPTSGVELADRYESTSKRVEYRIARAMGVPNELAGIQREGGMIFGDNELKMASRILQKKVNPDQRIIQETIQDLFRYWKNPADLPADGNYKIENQNYFNDEDNGGVVSAG